MKATKTKVIHAAKIRGSRRVSMRDRTTPKLHIPCRPRSSYSCFTCVVRNFTCWWKEDRLPTTRSSATRSASTSSTSGTSSWKSWKMGNVRL
eukprot:3485619-Amphidinium_carterae.1